jgi:hypothetical protein
MNDLEQLQHNLTNHPPVNDRVVRDLEFMRLKAFDFGEVILASCPPSRERSLAITNLEQTVMWAIASIARNQSAEVPE